MAVASGPAGPVLAGPVFDIVYGIAHAQNSDNVRISKNSNHTCTSKCHQLRSFKTCSNAKLPAAYMYLLPGHHMLIAIIHLTVDRCGHTWRRWSLTTPPERRVSNIAACNRP